MDDEEEETCPLCMENLDLTDQAATLCNCGYRICLWCWHRIMEDAAKDSLPGRCPNCREPYDKERITNATVDPDKIASEMQKKKEEKKKGKVVTDRKSLANVRVIQRNLVYVVGLSMNLCREEALRRNDYFGQFGRIVKISVNRNSPYSAAGKQGPTGSAYVTFFRPQDAFKCIEGVDGATWDGRAIRACFGTTKYCNSFLKGMQCTNPDCLYLHEITAEDGDCFTKEQMLQRYGNKSANFFELTHPLGKAQDQGGKHHHDLNGMDVHESEMNEEHMRSNPQNIPIAGHLGQGVSHGGNWGTLGKGYSQPSPPGSGGMAIMGSSPYGQFGSGFGMGPGGGPMGMVGMAPGQSPPGGMMHHPGSGGGSSQDGPSWGQVAASSKAGPPPPPPQPATAVEEWPELGGGPGGAANTGLSRPPSSSGLQLRQNSGKVKFDQQVSTISVANGKGSEPLESLGGIMVSKPSQSRSKAPGAPGSSSLGSPGTAPGPPGSSSSSGFSASSPFLSAAGAQIPPSQPKLVSGMVTMSIPNPQGAVSSSLRPGSGSLRPNKSKPPPPGFGSPVSQPPAAGALRGPPPGFGPGPGSGSSTPGHVSNGSGKLVGSLDNDQLSSLVESLKAGLEPTCAKPTGPELLASSSSTQPSGASTSQHLGLALQGLDLLGNSSQSGLGSLSLSDSSGTPSNPGSITMGGSSSTGPAAATGVMSALPPGFDVWSPDVPPAYAGLATASYNPLGFNTPAADPSARYLLRHPPGSSSGLGTAGPSGARQGQDGSGDAGSRSKSRFQFAREDDSTCGTADPLWAGASGEWLPAALDVFQVLKQGNSAATLKGAPPGFGGTTQRSFEGAVPPGMALLQRLQMGGAAGMPFGLRDDQSGSPAFLDPAIITSSSAAGLPAQMVPSSLQGTVRRPPGFGGSIAQQQRQPLFARGGDWHGQGRYGETQHRHVSTDSAEYSSWEQR